MKSILGEHPMRRLLLSVVGLSLVAGRHRLPSGRRRADASERLLPEGRHPIFPFGPVVQAGGRSGRTEAVSRRNGATRAAVVQIAFHLLRLARDDHSPAPRAG